MKALKSLFIISLCSVELLFGAGLKNEKPSNINATKSTENEVRYDFSIAFGISKSDFPESIVVTIKGKADSIRLNNLLFEFLAPSGSFWAFNEDFRFVKNPLIISKDSIFCKEFRLVELQFQSFRSKELVSFNTFRAATLSNPVIRVSASIGDMSKARNPYESNLWTGSNVIEIQQPK